MTLNYFETYLKLGDSDFRLAIASLYRVAQTQIKTPRTTRSKFAKSWQNY